jgi:hypothetical protein
VADWLLADRARVVSRSVAGVLALPPACDVRVRWLALEAATGGAGRPTHPTGTSWAMVPRDLGGIALIALGLIACAMRPADVAGRYRQEEPIAATLDVREDGDQYAVRLEGGGAPDAAAATAADCIIEARGVLDGAVLHARFAPVETDTFSYGAAQAGSEGRILEIAFEPGAALVREADTFGYCGLDAAFAGRYRKDP